MPSKFAPLSPRALDLASHLRALSEDVNFEIETHEFLNWSDLRNSIAEHSDRFATESILSTAAALDSELENIGFNEFITRSDGEPWSIGVGTIYMPPRDVLRGSLRPMLSLPIARDISARVFAYLTQLGDGDWLKRENHNFGWHYHYLNWKQKRTDVVLCWDVRWDITSDSTKEKIRPLFWEFHAERNAKLAAKPRQWKAEKRSSIYEACKVDLKRSIYEFRMASDDSEPVWPVNSVITPKVDPRASRASRK